MDPNYHNSHRSGSKIFRTWIRILQYSKIFANQQNFKLFLMKTPIKHLMKLNNYFKNLEIVYLFKSFLNFSLINFLLKTSGQELENRKR